MTDTITLDRHLRIGVTTYQVTVFPGDDDRLDLCVVSTTADGQVISELTAALNPADLPALTSVLRSTLAALIPLTGSGDPPC